MPWQRQVLDVALEVLDDGSWAYRLVVVTVQRQAGKTTLVGPLHLHRAMTRPRPTYLTAQKRSDARDTWLDVVNRFRLTPLAALSKIRESNGDEGVWPLNGLGSFRLFAPTEDALHGKANELVTIDEGWAFDEAQGAALEQAVLPTFTTTGGQLWLPSTAGHGRSTWLRGYVDRGRAAVEADQRAGTAYFEWSLPPEVAAAVAAGLDGTAADRDAALDLVLTFHPAAGRTVNRGALQLAADSMTPDQFLRAYGNVWTATTDRVIPEHVWNACRADHWTPPEPGRVALAFDVALDQSAAAITAAWRDSPTGPLRVDVIDSAPGTAWLAPRLRELRATWRPVDVAHNGGPALAVADELGRTGCPVRLLTAGEYATACSSFLSGVQNRRVEHYARADLDAAVALAATRPLGDAWAWSRRNSSGSIAALVGATVAGFAFDHRPAAAVRPRVGVARRRQAA